MHDNIYEPRKAKPAYNLVRRELVTGLRYMVLKTPGSNKYAQGKNHQKKLQRKKQISYQKILVYQLQQQALHPVQLHHKRREELRYEHLKYQMNRRITAKR
jgi:hypothetical protein